MKVLETTYDIALDRVSFCRSVIECPEGAFNIMEWKSALATWEDVCRLIEMFRQQNYSSTSRENIVLGIKAKAEPMLAKIVDTAKDMLDCYVIPDAKSKDASVRRQADIEAVIKRANDARMEVLFLA